MTSYIPAIEGTRCHVTGVHLYTEDGPTNLVKMHTFKLPNRGVGIGRCWPEAWSQRGVVHWRSHSDINLSNDRNMVLPQLFTTTHKPNVGLSTQFRGNQIVGRFLARQATISIGTVGIPVTAVQ